MIFESYKLMLKDYDHKKTGVLGLSFGATAAMTMISWNNYYGEKLPMPALTVGLSPGHVPANSTERKLPHGLFQIYNSKRLVGVISKTDLPDADVDAVEEILRDFGIDGEIFKVSIYSESSIDKLREFLSKEY